MATTIGGAVRQIEGRSSDRVEVEVLRIAADPNPERRTWVAVYRRRWTTETADESARQWTYYAVSVGRKNSFGVGNFSYRTEEAAIQAMEESLARRAENYREELARNERIERERIEHRRAIGLES